MKASPSPLRMASAPVAATRLAATGVAGFLLAGCVLGSGGHGRSLAEGHYFISSRFDTDYAYEQYFVVRADRRYEWVEYGYNAATNQVCKVTRHAGSYGLADSSLGLEVQKDAGPRVKCGFTKSDFQAMEWTQRKEAATLDFQVRDVDEDGFEAKDFFFSTGNYKAMVRKGDPYGFHD